MPKNTVSDPITDQEMAFAHLVLSGTMNDRRAAEAVGLNPDTAAYTKSKPRVRAYMIEHRAAVREKLVDQEAEGLRKLNLGRDQILARLWELANLSHERNQRQHRRPDQGPFDDRSHRRTDSRTAASPHPKPNPRPRPSRQQIYTSQWLRKQQHQAAGRGARRSRCRHGSPTRRQPGPRAEPRPPSTPPLERNHPSPANPFIIPEAMKRVPAATDRVFDAVLDTTSSLRLPLSPKKGPFARRR